MCVELINVFPEMVLIAGIIQNLWCGLSQRAIICTNTDVVKIGVFTMCVIRTDKNSRESASQINLGAKFIRELSDFLDTLGFVMEVGILHLYKAF